LGLKARLYANGKIELDLQSAGGDPLPSVEEAQGMVERILYDPERKKARHKMLAPMDARLRRAGLEHVIPEERRSVMSTEITPPYTSTSPE
jgi:hypothetical protein